MQTYTQSMTDGQSATFQGGKFFQVMEAPFTVDIIFFNRGGAVLGTANGIKAGFIRRSEFARVQITSNGPQMVQLAISEGDGEYNRGIVTIDSVPNREYPEYIVSAACIALVAGTMPQLLMFNPVGSGIIAYIRSVGAMPTVLGGRIQIYRPDEFVSFTDGENSPTENTQIGRMDNSTDLPYITIYHRSKAISVFVPQPALDTDTPFIMDKSPTVNVEAWANIGERPVILRENEGLVFWAHTVLEGFNSLARWEERNT